MQNQSSTVQKATKEERYAKLRSQLEQRLNPNSHPLANTSNFLALLMQQFKWWWVGFYWVRYAGTQKQHLALGQFQGPPACSMLFRGKGVCAAAWTKNQSVTVEDVDNFEGHVACSAASKSQIVVPVKIDGKVIGVLDIDSTQYSSFDQTDEKELKDLLEMINKVGHFKWFAENY